MHTDSNTLISPYLKEYNQTYTELNAIYHEAARKMHLSDSAFDILYGLYDMGDSCQQRDICNASCMPKQTVHSSISKLEKEGYLTLVSGTGRNKYIRLTDSGKELIEKKLLPLIYIENDAFNCMSTEECVQMLTLNKKYAQALRQGLAAYPEDL